MANVLRPAPSPCGSCPYRRDVPSGVWSEEEYRKLPEYDGETWEQPPRVFMCHQQDERLCAGWVGCHDMAESFGLRMAAQTNMMNEDEINATLDYVCPVPLFESGAAAAAHGLAKIEAPEMDAVKVIVKLKRRHERG